MAADAETLPVRAPSARRARPSQAARARRPEPRFIGPASFPEFESTHHAGYACFDDADPALSTVTTQPLGLAAHHTANPRRKWIAVIAISCALHAAVALFLIHLQKDDIQIAGGEQAGVAMLGNAEQDQATAGEAFPDATEVSIIPLSRAKPVATASADSVPVEETMRAEETVAAEAPASEVAQPVTEVAKVPAKEADIAVAQHPAEPIVHSRPSAATIAEVASPTAVQVVSPIATAVAAATTIDAQPAVNVASAVPPLLAVSSIEPVHDGAAAPERIEAFVAAETAAQAPAQSVTEVARPVDMPPAETVPLAAPVTEMKPEAFEVRRVPANEKQTEQKTAGKTPPRRKHEKAKATRSRAKEEVAENSEHGPKPDREHADERRQQAAGSHGANENNSRRGSAEGKANGKQVKASNGGKSPSWGNAAVSNYPGKIVSRLRRALVYPPAAERQGLRGEAVVQFVVSASGGVSGLRLVRSSGSSVLDQAALETVRRAAPFPPIPADAGRSNWPFTVPLAFTR